MSDVGFFVWKVSSMPEDPWALVRICKQFGIKRLAFKVLDGKWPYNVQNGDKKLKAYFDVLRSDDIIVEAWGWHYPDQAGAQGDAIEERRQKLGFSTYHLNAESPFKEAYGMPKAAKAILDKLKDRGFETLLCSYRFLSAHPKFPANAFMNHEKTDGASPQNYWALAHDPEAQLEACLVEYSPWGKPVYPVGPTFGAKFKLRDEWVYWEPTIEELVEFREACKARSINRFYYYSLDWALAHNRFDWIEAATGINSGTSPEPPSPEPATYLMITNCTWLNCRSEPTSVVDNRIATIRAGQFVENMFDDSGEWKKVSLGTIRGWMHGDYLEPVA
jgi:hypothetical protein